MHKLNAANIPTDLLEKGQNRVIEASLTLIRERAKLKVNPDFPKITLFGCLCVKYPLSTFETII